MGNIADGIKGYGTQQIQKDNEESYLQSLLDGTTEFASDFDEGAQNLASSILPEGWVDPYTPTVAETPSEIAHLDSLRQKFPDKTDEELLSPSFGNTVNKFAQSATTVTGNMASGAHRLLSTDTSIANALAAEFAEQNYTALPTNIPFAPGDTYSQTGVEQPKPDFQGIQDEYNALASKNYEDFDVDEKAFWNSEAGNKLHGINKDVQKYKHVHENIERFKTSMDEYVVRTVEDYRADEKFSETYKNSGGGVTGTLSGMLEMVSDNPELAPVSFIENLPYMLAFAYGGAATKVTLIAAKDEENLAAFVKEKGREPTLKERARITVDSVGSVLMESFGDKYVLRGKVSSVFKNINKILPPGLTRVIGSTGTETISGAGSEAFDQDARLQDLSKLDDVAIANSAAREGIAGLGGGGVGVARESLNNPALLDKIDKITQNNPGIFPPELNVSSMMMGDKTLESMPKPDLVQQSWRATAEDMDKEGTPMQQIWEETGFVKKGDGKWRFEVDDASAELTAEGVSVIESRGGAADLHDYKLGQILKHDEMYKVAPGLKDSKVRFYKGRSSSRGYYNDENDTLYLNLNRFGANATGPGATAGLAAKDVIDLEERIENLKADPKKSDKVFPGQLKSWETNEKQIEELEKRLANRKKDLKTRTDSDLETTLHEVQHAVQQREGFARGGSPEEFIKEVKAEMPWLTSAEKIREEAHDRYVRLLGEQESNETGMSVENGGRRGMTPEQLKGTMPGQMGTNDTALYEPIIKDHKGTQWKMESTDEERYKASLIEDKELTPLEQERLNETTEDWNKRLEAEAPIELIRDEKGNFPGEKGVSYTTEEFRAFQKAQGTAKKAYKDKRNKARAQFFRDNAQNTPKQMSEEYKSSSKPLERHQTGMIDQMSNDDIALVGGMRSGNSKGDETRRMYTLYDMKNMDEDFANAQDQEIGNIQLFTEDATDKIRGIVDIKIPTSKRKQGHARKAIESIVASEFSNKPFKIYDITKTAYPFWKKMGVTFVNHDFGKDIGDTVGKRHRLKGSWGTVNAYIGTDADIKKTLKKAAKTRADEAYKAQLTAPVDDLGFYSKAEKAVRSIKKGELRPELVFSITKKGKAVGVLPEAGVSTEQIKNMGIDRILQEKTANGENITKQELFDFVTKNKTQFSSEEYMSSGGADVILDDISMVGQPGANVTMGDDEGRVATFAEEALAYLGHDNTDSDISWEEIISRVHKYDPTNFPANNTTKAYEIDLKLKALRSKEGARDRFTGTLEEDWAEYQELEKQRDALLKDNYDVAGVDELKAKNGKLSDRWREVSRQIYEHIGDKTLRQLVESGDPTAIALQTDRNRINSQRQALDFQIDIGEKTPRDWSGDLKRELLENGGVDAYEDIDNPALVNALSQAAEGAAQAKYEADAIYDWGIETAAGEYSVRLDPEEMSYDISGPRSERVGEYNHQEDVISAIRRDLQNSYNINGTGNTEWSHWTANEGNDVDLGTYREIPIFTTPLEGQETATREQIGGHSMGGVSDENTISHLRVSDKLDSSDEKVLYIHEQQSDWAQTAREVGVTEEENTNNLKKAHVAMRKLSESRDMWAERLDSAASMAASEIRKELQKIDTKISNKRRSIEKIKEGPIPKPPMGVIEAMEVSLQTAIKIAADEGYSKVAWSTPEEQTGVYGTGFEELYENHYGKNIPKYAKKYAEKYGSHTGKVKLHSKKQKNATEYGYIEVTDELKKHVQKGMGYAKGGLVTNSPSERQFAHKDYLNSLIK